MRSAKPPETVLFLSPCAPALTFPELGLPQLAAYLRSRGRSVAALDLNALFLGEFLRRPDARRLLRRRGAVPQGPLLSGTPWGPTLQEGATAESAAWAKLLAVRAASWDIGDVLAAAARPDGLYELFFRLYVEPAAAGAALAGFSVLTHHQAAPALYLARRLKERYPGLKVCFGGPWCTASRPAVAGWPGLFDFIDAAVFYAGEQPLEGLIDWARGRRRLGKVPGLAWRDGRRVRLTPLRPGPPLEKLPPPDFSGFDLALYPRRLLPYQTTSGCEWGRCLFCYHCLPEHRFRMKPPALAARHLELLKRRTGVSGFWLADLSAPAEMLEGLSRSLAARGAGVSWTAMARAGSRWTADFSRRLAAAGCAEVFFGLETSDRASLDRINKGLTPEIFESSVRACAAAGIRASAFILRYPNQPAGEFRRTLAYARRLRGSLAAVVVADFELGRSSNAMRHLGRLGVSLPPRSGRDIRSFSLPYGAPRKPRPADLLALERAHGAAGNAGRPALRTPGRDK